MRNESLLLRKIGDTPSYPSLNSANYSKKNMQKFFWCITYLICRFSLATNRISPYNTH